MTTFLITLSFLILSATRVCSAETETGNTTTNENQNCSIPQLREAVQEFNKNGNWTPVKTRLEAAVNFAGSAYKLLQLTQFFPLHYIGFSGNTQLASLLLCNGLDVNTTNVRGRTILHGAALNNQVQMVKMLLAHGADVNTRDRKGDTPIHVAAYWGRLDVVKEMVQAGANTTVRNNYDLTALDVALFFNRPRVSEYLEQFPH